MRNFTRALLGLLILPLTAIAQKNENPNSAISRNLEVFNDIYKQLDIFYVDSLNADTVIGWAIRSMLQHVDPFTTYYPENDEELRQMATGKYAGIGSVIRFHRKEDRAVISEPYEGTPSQKAGIKAGDVIMSIDGKDIKGMPTDQVSSMLRGEAGTTFELRIKRPGEEKERSFTITRQTIQMPQVPYYGIVRPGVGYIYLTGFTDGASREVRQALKELKTQGAQSLILDLRDNPGGALNEAVEITNLFVAKGKKVVSTKGKMTNTNREYLTATEPVDSLMPLVVLVDGGSASSSEIVCGSLQDMDRAVVMGTRTYGKGLVQMIRDVPYRGDLKITTSRYYIPSGRCIQAINYKQGEGVYQEHIPDSLTKVFHTANGREVRDGGGITPDLVVKPDSLPNIAYYLGVSGRDSTETMFEYEVDYLASHPNIGPVSSFEITDADYENFKQRAIANGFTYDPESDRAMKALKKIMEFEGYYEEAKPEFEALEKKLQHNLSHDLDLHKETLKRMISSDIVAAYYYQRGTVEYNLKHDKQMAAARDLLNDLSRYKQLLEPKSIK